MVGAVNTDVLCWSRRFDLVGHSRSPPRSGPRQSSGEQLGEACEIRHRPNSVHIDDLGVNRSPRLVRVVARHGHRVGGDIMKASLSRWSTLIVIASLAMGCAHHRSYNLPPAERLMEPGPGVGGPGPGVIPPAPVVGTGMAMPMGPMGMGLEHGPRSPCGATQTNVQMLFARPEGMQIRWDVSGQGYFDSEPLVVPGRYSFPQGGIYRLKVTNIEGREGVELYPTLEVGPVTPLTEAYLAHNAVPIQFTAEDFDQVSSGNFVTKVIYLPDPEFQELALAGVETLVSTRLDPGIDPIVEADRRGAILAIIRIGNKDLEMPGSEGEMGGVMPASRDDGVWSPGHVWSWRLGGGGA